MKKFLRVLALSLPTLLAGVPAGVQDLDLEGTLQVAVEDYRDGGSAERVQLRNSAGQISELEFQGPRPRNLRSGSRIRLQGARRLGSSGKIVVPSVATISAIEQTQVAPVSGLKNLAVIRVTSADGQVSCSASELANGYFTASDSVRNYFEASSFGLLSYSSDGDGNGQVDVFEATVNYATTDLCDYQRISDDARADLAARGISLAPWHIKVFVLPDNTHCSWLGVGLLANGSGTSWIAGDACGARDVAAHEIGHNNGLDHAGTDVNNDGVLEEQYGDMSCPMGWATGGLRHFNVVHSSQEGWLPAEKMFTATSSGSYTVSALELDPAANSNPYVVKIKRVSGADYYLSYRRAVGAYSSNLPVEYRDRVSVHYGFPTRGRSFFVKALGVGESFSDPTSEFSVTVSNTGATTATINVNFSCTRGSPALSVTPATQLTLPGGSKDYIVSVTNKDSIGCGPQNFALTCDAAAGTSCAVAPMNNVPTGGSAQTTLTLTANPTAGNGTYSTKVGIAGRSPTSTVMLGVDASPPTTPFSLAARPGKKQVRLTWQMSPVPRAKEKVQYRIYRNGVNVGQTKRRGFVDKKLLTGTTYTYTVVAVDNVGNTSSSSAQVTVTTKGVPPA